MDVLDGILLGFQELGNAVGSGGSVVATHGYQQLDVVLPEQVQVEVILKVRILGLETGHLEIRTAPVEIRVRHGKADFFVAGSLGEKAAVTAMKAEHTVIVGKECFCYRHNDGVHARSRAAATKDNDGIFHNVIELV